MLYRVFRNERKKKLKVTHAIVMISAFLLSVIGLKAVFDFHNLTDKPNLYSLHSWMGLGTVILFAMQVGKLTSKAFSLTFIIYLLTFFQWVGGLVTFLFPGLASHLRARFMPAHVFFGLTIFILACATALLGITEKLIFSL